MTARHRRKVHRDVDLILDHYRVFHSIAVSVITIIRQSALYVRLHIHQRTLAK